MESDINLLRRTQLWLTKGHTCMSTISLILCYLFQSNFEINLDINYNLKDENLVSLISFLPEIKENFDKIIEIANAPQNNWYGDRQIYQLTQIQERLRKLVINDNVDIQLPVISSEESEFLYISLTKARKWYQNGQIGHSSAAICKASLLQNLSLLDWTPNDKHDMNGCILLINDVPELKNHISTLMRTRGIKLKFFLLLADVLTKFNPWTMD